MTMSNSEARKRATPDPDPHAPDWLPAHDAKVAARALREVVAIRAEWQAELNRQDDRHYASGSMHGAGPDVACDVFETFLTARADEIERAGRAGGGS